MVHRVLPRLPTVRRHGGRARVAVAAALLATALAGTSLVWSAAGATEPSEPSRAPSVTPGGAAETSEPSERSRTPSARGGGPGGRTTAPEVEFVCDPNLSHGQNVSAYARSLPRGPGRGQQVSEAARSDCGR